MNKSENSESDYGLIRNLATSKRNQIVLQDRDSEITNFSKVLSFIPKSRGNSSSTFSQSNDNENWQQFVISQIMPQKQVETDLIEVLKIQKAGNSHPPSLFLKEPSQSYFNCRKSVYKHCQSAIAFTTKEFHISSILSKDVIQKLFVLASQEPQTGNMRSLNSLLIISLKLIESLRWPKFSKKLRRKVVNDLVYLAKSLKNFYKESQSLLKLSQKILERGEKVYRGFSGNYFKIVYEESKRYEEKILNNRENKGEFSEAHVLSKPIFLGFTDSNELIMGEDQEVLKVSMLPDLSIVSLLATILSYTKVLLDSSVDILIKCKKETDELRLPSKWKNVSPTPISNFEVLLLQKSQKLLVVSATESRNLALYANYQIRFVNELRVVIKGLKKNLVGKEYYDYDPLLKSTTSFKIEIEDNDLKNYIVRRNWKNEDIATEIVKQYAKN